MISTITILTSMLFAVIYPLCFWISSDQPLKNNFHRFHIGLCDVMGALAVISIWTMPFSFFSKILSLLWIIILLIISFLSWNKSTPNTWLLTFTAFIGLIAFSAVHIELTFSGFFGIASSILGGIILSLALYAMNLGHWYLNVHGLPILHLQRTVNVFFLFTIIRFLWDVYFFFVGKTIYQGEAIPLYMFAQTLIGCFIFLAFFFGTLFPLIALQLVNGTLRVKSTQSATGILYVIVIAIFIGEITYKYFLIQFGITL